jgi:hypothetical protein
MSEARYLLFLTFFVDYLCASHLENHMEKWARYGQIAMFDHQCFLQDLLPERLHGHCTGKNPPGRAAGAETMDLGVPNLRSGSTNCRHTVLELNWFETDADAPQENMFVGETIFLRSCR